MGGTLLWHVQFVRNRDVSPSISGLHAEFYGATPITFDPENPMKRHPRPLRVAKNIYLAAELIPADGSLLVSETLLGQITRCCLVRSRPVKIEIAYRFPFHPDDFSYMTDPAFREEVRWVEQVAIRFARRYRCDYSGPSYRELIISIASRARAGEDYREFHVRGESFLGTDDWDFGVSPSEVDRLGIVRALGFVVSDAMMSIIGPHFIEPYFSVTRLLC